MCLGSSLELCQWLPVDHVRIVGCDVAFYIY